MKKKRGKLIVIDGSDGSGKATQAKELVKRLKKNGHNVRTLDFPQYNNNHFGSFIRECQEGKHGDFVHLDARIASVLYAADRFESKAKIEKWLAAGDVVVLDRYVSSNQIHQGGKIKSSQKRVEYVQWQEHMEYKVFGLPRPNITFFLEVPVAVAKDLLNTSGKQQDTVEGDVEYQKNSLVCARWLAKNKPQWHQIKCAQKNQMRNIEDIHENIIALLVATRIIKKPLI